MKIAKVYALEILDSRGNPTVRCCVELEDKSKHFSSVPSGASTGSHEAVELRDHDKSRYRGKGVLKAVEIVNTVIAKSIEGLEADPKEIDKIMLGLDATSDKSNLGANAILSVSMAVTRAAAHAEDISLWQFLRNYYFQNIQGQKSNIQYPKLMVNIINGGKHADWNFDIQEFMIVPNSNIPSEAVRIASEIFHSLGTELKKRELSTLVGDEGGYSPALKSNEEVFEVIVEAGKNAGYENVQDFRLSIDSAASEFYENHKYVFKKSDQVFTPDELSSYYALLAARYKLLSFEDAFAENDLEAFENFQKTADQFQFLNIGDDLFATNPDRIGRGIKEKWANGVIIKLNQIGTLSETVEAIKLTQNAGWKIAISHRSGETEDSFIADLAYACGADFLKSGSMSRSERLAKYNRLLEIEHRL